MQQNNTLLSLTMDLLAGNAFNHLRDEEVSALHHFILRLTEPLTPVQQNLLFSAWYHADAASLSPDLLHRCNTLLLQSGRRPLEPVEMEMEMY